MDHNVLTSFTLKKHGRVGDYRVEKPMILGHESAGIITQVGPKVTGLQVGDRVALEPGEVSLKRELTC